jgi:hypothetical protein
MQAPTAASALFAAPVPVLKGLRFGRPRLLPVRDREDSRNLRWA